MKEVTIILDGLMEKQLENISIKNLLVPIEEVHSEEVYTNYSVEQQPIDSLVCIMNILGYNANKINIGERAYYEALSRGIPINDDELVLRCNVVKIKDDKLIDFTGGDLPYNIKELVENIVVNKGRLYHCQSYKNLLVLQENIKDCLYPPHFNIGVSLEDIMPKSESIVSIIKNSYEYFKSKGLEGLILWPWGISRRMDLPKFPKNSAVISGTDLIIGIGRAIGMNTIEVNGVNGEYNTNLNNKLMAAKSNLLKYDYLLIHINGFDELAHRYDFEGKLKFTEKVKDEFLVPFIKYAIDFKDIKIRITCDHRTDSTTGSHMEGDVPVIIINT